MTIKDFVAYVKQAWYNKPNTSTPVEASRLLHIENGIKGNSDAIEKIAAAVVNQIVNDPDKIASMAALFSVNQNLTNSINNLDKRIKFTYKEIKHGTLTFIVYIFQFKNMCIISARTWASGLNANIKWGGVYCTQDINTDYPYPVTFSVEPMTFLYYTPTNSNGLIMATSSYTKTAPPRSQLVRGTSVDNISGTIHIISIGLVSE